MTTDEPRMENSNGLTAAERLPYHHPRLRMSDHRTVPRGRPPRAANRRCRGSTVAAAAFAVLAALWVAACDATAAGNPNTAVIGTAEDFETVNELIAQGSSFNDTVVDQLFLQLVEEQADSQQAPATFKPRLARAWSFSPDRLQLTFELRDDVRWSDGQPVTAEDVRFSWEAQRSPEVEWGYAFVKDAIIDVEVIDAHTARFHFSRASASQIEDANEGVILPRHEWSRLPFSEWRENPTWFRDHLVTAGPFLLESWTPQQRVVLIRNPNYFEAGLPRLERVIMQYVPEPSGLVGQLLAGNLDFVPRVPPGDAQRVAEHPDLRLYPFPTRQFTFVSWNTLRPQFDDPEVRRALALAIDRQTIVDTLWHGYAVVGWSPIVSSFWAVDRDIEPWPYDPELAKSILDDRGWIDRDGDGVRERDGVPFRFELTTNPGDATRWDAMLMIQAQLRGVGIEAVPRRIEYQTLNALNYAHDYEATVSAFLMDTTLDLGYAFHSRSIDGGFNFGSYRNDEVDRLVDLVANQLDYRASEAPLHRLQEILHQEQPLLFLWEPSHLVAARAELENLQPNMISEHFHLWEWSKSAPAEDR